MSNRGGHVPKIDELSSIQCRNDYFRCRFRKKHIEPLSTSTKFRQERYRVDVEPTNHFSLGKVISNQPILERNFAHLNCRISRKVLLPCPFRSSPGRTAPGSTRCQVDVHLIPPSPPAPHMREAYAARHVSHKVSKRCSARQCARAGWTPSSMD